MIDSLNRRQFVAAGVAATIALEWIDSQGRASGADLSEILEYVDPRLRPPTRTPSKAENSYRLIISATKLVSALPQGDFEPEDCFNTDKPDPARDERIAKWLDKHQPVLTLVEQAVGAGKLAFPQVPWTQDRLDTVSSLRNLSRFLQLTAQRQASQGQIDDAARTSLVMSRLFRLAREGGGVLVEYLVAAASEGDSWNLVRRIGQSPQTPAKTIRHLLANLPERQDASIGIQRAIRSEYCHYLLPLLLAMEGLEIKQAAEVFLDWNEQLEPFLSRKKFVARCDKIAQVLQDHPKPFDLVDTVRLSSAHYGRLIDDCEMSWAKHRLQPAPVPTEELAAWPRQLSLSVLDDGDPDEGTASQLAAARQKLSRIHNPLGKKIVESCELDSLSMHRAALSNQARCEGTRLFLAMCVYFREHEKLPASLDELVQANILERIPFDPFSSNRFQYSREDQAIWSVGWEGRVSPAAVADDESDFQYHLWRLDTIK